MPLHAQEQRIRDWSRSAHEQCGEGRKSIRWQFPRINFEQPEPAVGDVLGFVQAVAQLYGSYKEIAAHGKHKISLRRRFEYSADDGGIVAAGNRRRDIQFMVGAIEELNGDPRMGSGPGILQYVKEWKIQYDFSISEHPRPSWHRRLIGGRRSQDCLPQALWRRALIGPCNLAEDTAQHRGEENRAESVDHRVAPLPRRHVSSPHYREECGSARS